MEVEEQATDEKDNKPGEHAAYYAAFTVYNGGQYFTGSRVVCNLHKCVMVLAAPSPLPGS